VTNTLPTELLGIPFTVAATEVADVIRLLPQKSSPLDVIPASLLKLSTDIMSPLIARFANLSFKDGVFPSRYKAARVTRLLKKPKRTDENTDIWPKLSLIYN